MESQQIALMILFLCCSVISLMAIVPAAYNRGRNFRFYIILGLIVTPMLAYMILLVMGKTKKKKDDEHHRKTYERKINEPSDGRYWQIKDSKIWQET